MSDHGHVARGRNEHLGCSGSAGKVRSRSPGESQGIAGHAALAPTSLRQSDPLANPIT